MASYTSNLEEATAENHSSSTSSWVAHRSYLAPAALKRNKNSEFLNNGNQMLSNQTKSSDWSYKNQNNSSSSTFNYNFNEDYDPRYPNDYDKVSKIILIKNQTKLPSGSPVVFGHPPPKESLVSKEPEPKPSGDEVLKRRLELMDKSEIYTEHVDQKHLETVSEGVSEVERLETKKSQPIALKMMEKMGWKEGEGLGKNRQGMVTPLIAKATGKNSGIIVNALPKKRGDTKSKQIVSHEVKDKVEETELPKSRVCIMVFSNKKELDMDELEEIASEYGSLINIKFLDENQLVTIPQNPECSNMFKVQSLENSSVAIFEYETEEQAGRLVSDLNGSNVMESQVKVYYFPLEVYNSL